MARKALIVKSKRKKQSVVSALKAGRDPEYPTREYNRCELCGRNRAYMRYFQICRICFRELVRKSEIPGVRKSSW